MIKIEVKPVYDSSVPTNMFTVDISIGPNTREDINYEVERQLCLVREMLRAQEVKQKTWGQPEGRMEAPQEQESSIHSNDQKSLEKEQSQRTVKTNKKQYIISYPQGVTKCLDTGTITNNCTIAQTMLEVLREGGDTLMPNDWKVQVIDL